jgi:hypothetical protein
LVRLFNKETAPFTEWSSNFLQKYYSTSLNNPFFGGFAAEKTPPRRAKRVRAPWGAVKILDFGGGNKRAHPQKAGSHL